MNIVIKTNRFLNSYLFSYNSTENRSVKQIGDKTTSLNQILRKQSNSQLEQFGLRTINLFSFMMRNSTLYGTCTHMENMGMWCWWQEV